MSTTRIPPTPDKRGFLQSIARYIDESEGIRKDIALRLGKVHNLSEREADMLLYELMNDKILAYIGGFYYDQKKIDGDTPDDKETRKIFS